jgi:hypothetical protein
MTDGDVEWWAGNGLLTRLLEVEWERQTAEHSSDARKGRPIFLQRAACVHWSKRGGAGSELSPGNTLAVKNASSAVSEDGTYGATVGV